MTTPPDTAPLPPIPAQASRAWAAWEEGFTRDHAPCGVCAPSPWVHGAQPPPRLTEASQPVWPALEAELGQLPKTVAPDRLLAQLAARVALGRAKYGVELHTHDGRDPWIDANEEILDLLQYLARLALAGHLPHDTYRYLLTLTTTLWTGLDHAQRRELLVLAEACGSALPSRASVAQIVGWQRVERAEAEAISEAAAQAQEAVEDLGHCPLGGEDP